MIYIHPWQVFTRPNRVKTPTVLQMEAVECGAAALGSILGYYGRYVPLAELRQACGVSRDGVTAANVLKAARYYGLEAAGFKKSLSRVQQVPPPFMVFWHFNHFLVVEGFQGDRIALNDPATGPRQVTLEEFDQGYTGITLTFSPGERFTPGGHPPRILRSLVHRLSPARGALLLTVAAGLLLVLPTLTLPALNQIFIDDILVGDQDSWLPYVLGVLLLTAGIQAWLTALQRQYLRAMRIKLAVGMTSRFVWHLLRLPADFYGQRFAGEIASRIRLNDEVAQVLSGRLTTTVISLVLATVYAVAMALYDWLLTLLVVGLATVNILVLQWAARHRVDANLRLAQERGKVSGVAIAGLQTIETLKASGLESDFFARWSGYYTKSLKAQQALSQVNRLVGVLPELISTLTAMALLLVGGWRVINGSLTIGMLIAFQLLMQSFQRPVNQLVSFGSTLQTLQGNLNRLDDVLQTAPADTLDSRRQEMAMSSAASRLPCDPLLAWGQGPNRASPTSPPFNSPRLSGAIALHHLTFGYQPLAAPLIRDFNLSIRPGQRIALVGGSGSGKSTLARVIAGLYPAWEGDIYFDGRPRHHWPAAVLSQSIAFVDQDIVIFEGSIRDNLTLWDSTIPDADLRRATQDAAIESVILAQPCGYDAPLMEGATNLSGGQRQRLEIARALINNPAILILDEATSALDSTTEYHIDQNLRRRGCTCILVAHRLSTIRDCDEIIVLDRGTVVQRGTHEQLWSQGGHYAELLQQET